MVAISGLGSSATAAGSTGTVAAHSTSAVRPAPATITSRRKRVATIAPGITSQESTGLVGPPSIATPAPITSSTNS